MGCARVQKPLPGLAPVVEIGRRTGAYASPLAVPFQANIGPLRADFFSGTAEFSAGGENRRETGCLALRAKRSMGFLRVPGR